MRGDFEDTRRSVANMFAVGWRDETSVPLTRIEWPNGETFEPAENESWVRFSIQSGVGVRRTIGPEPVFRRVGQVVIQIFTPANTGDGAATRHADAVATIYRDRTILTERGMIRFGMTSIREIGSRDQLWHQTNVISPFLRDFVGDSTNG